MRLLPTLWGLLLVLLGMGAPHTNALAHGVAHGALYIDHPYAVPNAPGKNYTAVFFRGIQNKASLGDRLIGASSPVAARVGLYFMGVQDGAMRMQEIEAIALPPRATVPMRHNLGDYHLMVLGLAQDLKSGDRFDLTLMFERAGPQTVRVWVQTPKAVESDAHKH